MADNEMAARVKAEKGLKSIKVFGLNMSGEVKKFEREISALPPVPDGQDAEAGEIRVADRVLEALCEAQDKEVRNWALARAARAEEDVSWDELKEAIVSELVSATTARQSENADALVTLSRARDETLAAYFSRFENKAKIVGASLGPPVDKKGKPAPKGTKDESCEFLMLRQLCLRGLRHTEVEKGVRRGIAMERAVTWPDFKALVTSEAGATWTSTPAVSAVSSVSYAVPGFSKSRGAERKRGQERARLADGEYERRMAQGLCFICGEKGIARDCPRHAPSAVASGMGNGRAGGGQ